MPAEGVRRRSRRTPKNQNVAGFGWRCGCAWQSTILGGPTEVLSRCDYVTARQEKECRLKEFGAAHAVPQRIRTSPGLAGVVGVPGRVPFLAAQLKSCRVATT